MTRHVAFNAILALGMLMVILNGGIDLSVGSTVGISGMIAGYLLKGGTILAPDRSRYPSVWVVVLVSLLRRHARRLDQRVLVARLNVAPFIATLGMLYVVRGFAELIGNGQTFTKLGEKSLGNTGFIPLLHGKVLGIPFPIWVMIVMAIVFSVSSPVPPSAGGCTPPAATARGRTLRGADQAGRDADLRPGRPVRRHRRPAAHRRPVGCRPRPVAATSSTRSPRWSSVGGASGGAAPSGAPSSAPSSSASSSTASSWSASPSSGRRSSRARSSSSPSPWTRPSSAAEAPPSRRRAARPAAQLPEAARRAAKSAARNLPQRVADPEPGQT